MKSHHGSARIVAQLNRPKPKAAPNLRSTLVTMVKTTDTRPGYYLASCRARRSTFRSLLPETTVGAVLVDRPLGECIAAVRKIRDRWKLSEDKELWFRGEDAMHQSTTLQPNLYRPGKSMKGKPVDELFGIENHMYEEFQRCAVQLSDLKSGNDWEFEWYFLMQHHGCRRANSRTLDKADRANSCSHFLLPWSYPYRKLDLGKNR